MRRERGSALILAILVIALATAMGITLLSVSSSDMKMNQASVRSRRAFYVSEAGLENGRERFRANNLASSDKTSFDDELAAAAGANHALDVDPANLVGVFDAGGKPTGVSGYGDDVPIFGYTPFGTGGYATFLLNDKVDGYSNLHDTNNRVLLASIGAGPSRSIELSEVMIEQLHIPTPPGMITMVGPVAAGGFQGGTSSAKSYGGDDCASSCPGFTGDPAVHVPTVATTDTTSTTNAQAKADKGIFTSGSLSGPATVQDVSGTMDPLWLDCTYLRDLAFKVRTTAGYKCGPTGPCTPPWSTMTATSVTFADRDLVLQDGKGLLWVTGELVAAGNTSWQGTVIVVGKGSYQRSGGGSGKTCGAVIVANIAGPNGILGDGDDCTGPSAGFGSPAYVFDGAGNHDHVYCSAAIRLSESAFPTTVVGFRQR